MLWDDIVLIVPTNIVGKCDTLIWNVLLVSLGVFNSVGKDKITAFLKYICSLDEEEIELKISTHVTVIEKSHASIKLDSFFEMTKYTRGQRCTFLKLI